MIEMFGRSHSDSVRVGVCCASFCVRVLEKDSRHAGPLMGQAWRLCRYVLLL